MSLSNRFSYVDQPHETSTTQRKAAEALLLLSSLDRFRLNPVTNLYEVSVENGTYNNYQISTQKLLGAGQIKRLAVSEVQFPWTTPNVIDGVNNGFYFIRQTSPTVIDVVTITEGFYDGPALAGALQAALLAGTVPDVWTVAYNPDGTFTIQGVTTWIPAYPLQGGNSLNTLMNIFPSAPGFNNSYTSGFSTLQYTRYIDICSNTLCRYQTLKDSLTQFNHTNVLCRVYLNSGFNANNNFFGVKPVPDFKVQFTNPKYIEWNPDNMIGAFDIFYLDDAGKPLYIPLKNRYIAQYITFLMSES